MYYVYTLLIIVVNMECLQYVFYSVIPLEKKKGMHEGAPKQYQDPENSMALVRTAPSKVYIFSKL